MKKLIHFWKGYGFVLQQTAGKVSLIVTFTLVLSVIAIGPGCNKEESEISKEMQPDFNQVGLHHNLILEYIFDEIVTETFSGIMKEMPEYSLQHTNIAEQIKENGFLLAKSKGNIPEVDYTEMIFEGINVFLENFKVEEFDFIKNLRHDFEANFNQYSFEKSGPLFLGMETREQRFYLEKITEVIYKFGKAPDELKDNLINISNESGANLNRLDAMAINGAISTAYMSNLYWQENYRNWAMLVSIPELVKMFRESDFVSKTEDVEDERRWWEKIVDTFEEYFEIWWEEGGAEMVNVDMEAAFGGGIFGAATETLPKPLISSAVIGASFSAGHCVWETLKTIGSIGGEEKSPEK